VSAQQRQAAGRHDDHRCAQQSLQRRWGSLIAREPQYRRDAGSAPDSDTALAI